MIGDFPINRTIGECHYTVERLQKEGENVRINYEQVELVIDGKVVAKGRDDIHVFLRENYE